MESGNTKERINKIRDLIQKNNYSAIIRELAIIRENINDKKLNDQILLICSRHYEFQEKQFFGQEVNGIEIENFLKDVLNITDEAEKFINTIEVPKTTLTLNIYSNETILNILNLFFDKKNKAKDLSEEELADVYDTKVKLYDSIFKEFDKQLETVHNKNLSSVLFDRIISFEQIQKVDYDIIQNARNNNAYKTKDRSLLVSGITLSSINRFAANKIHLLIDYLTDFEEGVWQRALVGIILSLNKYDNRISLFPDVERRLEELKNLELVQESIMVIEKILRNRLFSIKETFLKSPDLFFKRFSYAFGGHITLSKSDVQEIQEFMNRSPTSVEERMVAKVFNHSKVEDLVKNLQNGESINLPLIEFFKVLDFKTYLELYELNPLQLDLSSDLYKNPRNWFIPFEDNEDLRNILINDFQSDEIEIVDFIKTLEENKGLSDIDKNSIVINIASYSSDFVMTLFIISNLEKYYLLKDNVSRLEISFTKILRELYRFQQLSIASQVKNVFEDKFAIYRKSLLEKIADNTVSDKINAKVCYDQKEYQKSLEILEGIPPSEYDLDILDLLAMNHIALEQYTKAISFINELLVNLRKSNADNITLVQWYKQARIIYNDINNTEEYEKCLDEEIALREAIFQKSLIEDQLEDEKLEKGTSLLNCYADQFVWKWNKHTDIAGSFNFIIKYFEALSKIPPVFFDTLEKEVQQRRANLLALIQILTLDENASEILEHIKTFLDNRTSTPITDSFRKMVEQFSELLDPGINQLFIEILGNDNAIKDKVVSLYAQMDPAFRIIVNTQPSTIKNVVVPFTIQNATTVEIKFSINSLFEQKEKNVLELLIASLTHKRKQEICSEIGSYFLDNIFAVQETIFDSKIEVLRREVYNDILSGRILIEKIDKVNARAYYDQKEYQKSLEILRGIPPSEYDADIADLSAMNYIALKQYTKAIPLVNVMLNLKKENADKIALAYWYNKAKFLYQEINNSEDYEKCLNEEIALRESIFDKSLTEDQLEAEKLEKGTSLLNCYASQFVWKWNKHKDITGSFNFAVKYLETLSKIPSAFLNVLEKEVQKNRENLLTLLQTLALDENPKETQKYIKTFLANRIRTQLTDNFRKMIEVLLELIDPGVNQLFIEILGNDNAIKDKVVLLYAQMEPVFRNIVNTQASTIENVVVPFTIRNETNIEVLFSIASFFEQKEKNVLEMLITSLTRVRNQEIFSEMGSYFLDNIFVAQKSPFDSKIDFLRTELYNDILSANLPILKEEEKQ